MQANELPMSYLDEVVRFIEKNTEGVSLGGGGGYSDPFTGRDSSCTHNGVSLTFFSPLKANRDTSRPVATCQTKIPVSTPSLGHPDTNHRVHHPAPLKVDMRTRSREPIDTNRHLLPGSRPRRLAPLHQPQVRVMSSLTYV